ncbi:MAG TPA: uroporphyrinogen decarboxylase family protein, partial [Chthonomonadaceae bacterium]|nr:uroporphyrinogen decarboxylase family protein [Chthonomonadaceae bacterium]
MRTSRAPMPGQTRALAALRPRKQAADSLGPAGDRLAGFDFSRHNEEVCATWAAYHAGRPVRTPILPGVNTRYYMRHPAANPEGLSFDRYFEDPDVMFEAQLRFQRWSRFNLLQDADLGMPERWQIFVDFQNSYEAAWFGCPIAFCEGEVPDTRPAFAGCPERVMERGLPDPFAGIMGRGLEYYERFRERATRETFLDRPIAVMPPGFGIGSDGPMTVACNLFGPDFVCLALAAEPERLGRLLEFITTAAIARMRAWRHRVGIPVPQDGFMMADDSIALISTAMLRAHVLPHLQRIYAALGTSVERGIHLCGNSTRHFRTLRDTLGIRLFDTGFPVDFGRLRRELGPDVRLQGGPHVELLRAGTPGLVYEEARRILQSGVLEGGLFVLR